MNGLRKKERKEGCMSRAWSMYGLKMLIMLGEEKSWKIWEENVGNGFDYGEVRGDMENWVDGAQSVW
jgi:hypothetical protein